MGEKLCGIYPGALNFIIDELVSCLGEGRFYATIFGSFGAFHGRWFLHIVYTLHLSFPEVRFWGSGLGLLYMRHCLEPVGIEHFANLNDSGDVYVCSPSLLTLSLKDLVFGFHTFGLTATVLPNWPSCS